MIKLFDICLSYMLRGDKMARVCKECGKKLSIFSTSLLCEECSKFLNEKYIEIKKDALKNLDLKEEQVNFLQIKFARDRLLCFYNEIYDILILKIGLKRKELEFLLKIKNSFALSDDEIGFDERMRPYIYVDAIKEKNELPDFKLEYSGFNIVLKQNERFHFAYAAVLNEIKTKGFEYDEGRSGVSFRIMKDVNYRAGVHIGNIMDKDRLVKTSRGILVITNQRILLNPFPGHKPLSIPLDKILSYQAYQNGIEVYKENRWKGFFFEIDSTGAVEVFGICLSFLLLGIS